MKREKKSARIVKMKFVRERKSEERLIKIGRKRKRGNREK